MVSNEINRTSVFLCKPRPTIFFFLPLFFLRHPFVLFASYLTYPITRYVCRSISCIVPGWLAGLRRAYRPTTRGKSNSGEIRRANRFSTPEILSLCMIDSFKKPSLLLVFFFVVFCFVRTYGDYDSGISSK